MSKLPPIDGLTSFTQAECDALRTCMLDAKYGDEVLVFAESLSPNSFDVVRLALVRWSLAERREPRMDMARLFLYFDALSTARCNEIFGAELFAALRRVGIVMVDGDEARCPFRLTPIDTLLFLSDNPALGGDTVMGPGPTTANLLGIMPSKGCDRVLDLGCGAGTLALHAAQQGAKHVFGVDLNERAIAVAKFNARLNRLDVDFRAGDTYAPVADERFDLIVAQPPYVIHPDDVEAVTFLHGGKFGDELALQMLAATPAMLAPAGRAIFAFDSAVRKDQPLHVRVRNAVGTTKVDALILTTAGHPPWLQAIGYASVVAPNLGPEYDRAVVSYRSHMARLGIEEVQAAVVVLRASPVGVFTAVLPVPRPPRGADTIDNAFAALDLASLDDVRLAKAAVSAPSNVRWVEERPRPDLQLEPARFMRFSGATLASDQELSEAMYALYELLDASASVEDAIAGYAELCGTTPDQVRRQVLVSVRQGLTRGLLQPRKNAA
jgi:SAM-dependent methyltransferase